MLFDVRPVFVVSDGTPHFTRGASLINTSPAVVVGAPSVFADKLTKSDLAFDERGPLSGTFIIVLSVVSVPIRSA